MNMKCPGQDTKYWKADAIFEVKCPKCDATVEFFKDDTSRKCGHCGHRFPNPKMDFGCAAYCPYADQCLGTLPEELVAQKEDLLKDRVAIEMKRYFSNDFKRIGHATRVARYADRIGKNERANLAVILCAAFLHDIGILEAKRKYGDAAYDYHEEEGLAVARSIMTKLNAKEELIDEVCDIVGHHHDGQPDKSLNFKVVYDADLIVNMEDDQKKNPVEAAQLTECIEQNFLTESGKKEAIAVLLK